MKKFRTELDIKSSEKKISYQTPVAFLGSCFTENIGNIMQELKMKADVNPFGNIYNPASIINSLNFLMEEKIFTEEDLINANGLWNSFYHHSSFSCVEKSKCLDIINKRNAFSSAFLKNADFIIITLGTAWAYEQKATSRIVSNCHKIPAAEFERKLLKTNDIVEGFEQVLNKLHQIKKSQQVIFTLSPIRHWKDGATDNMHSKAMLLVAIHELCEKFDFVSYFPAYEIMMDDLRDYRFYAEDMIHPSDVAVKYIWEKFSDCYFDQETLQQLKEISEISTALNHRPFNPGNETHKKFLQNVWQQILKLEKKYSYLDFSNEKKYLKEII